MLGNLEQFGPLPEAEVAIVQGRRYPAITVFRPLAQGITIPTGGGKTTVVEFQMPDGHQGFLTALGHEASNVGWTNITWAIEVDHSTVPGFGAQVGIQWGRLNAPGEVYAYVNISKAVRLTARNAAAADELVDAVLVGYHWPEDEPVR